MSNVYARLIKNQYRFRYQVVFSARFDKHDEDDQVLDELEVIINLNNQNVTQSDIDDIRSQLERQIQNQETDCHLFFGKLVDKKKR